MTVVITLYRLDTGEFARILTLPAKAIEQNVPEGYGFLPGRHDRYTKRVDVETGEVVEFHSPVDQEKQRVDIARQIIRLESQQHRALRELSIDPSNAEARERIEAIDAAIVQLRERLTPHE